MEIDKDFKTWAGSIFWDQADFKISAHGQILIYTHQAIFPAIHRKSAASLLAMTEDIRVVDGLIVLVISEDDSNLLVKTPQV